MRLFEIELDYVPILYHGTCEENAKSLLNNGWQPNSGTSGGNMGQKKYLYLTTGYEDAMWFAEEKGCNTVIAVMNVPKKFLLVDPEDGTGDTLDQELNNKHGLPGKVVLFRPLDASYFKALP